MAELTGSYRILKLSPLLQHSKGPNREMKREGETRLQTSLLQRPLRQPDALVHPHTEPPSPEAKDVCRGVQEEDLEYEESGSALLHPD